MSGNYLKRYYFEDRKLAQRARLEFYRALESGRLIAFTGSMTTEPFGYGKWDQLKKRVFGFADEIARKIEAQTDGPLHTTLRKKLLSRQPLLTSDKLADPVAMSLVEDTLIEWSQDHPVPGVAGLVDGHWPLDNEKDLHGVLRVKIASHFRKPPKEWAFDSDKLGYVEPDRFDDGFNIPKALWDAGIKRFATTNYDFELERMMMLADRDPGPASRKTSERASSFALLAQLRSQQMQNFSWDLGSGRIRRTFEDGWAIESDLLNRERIDRLIEFAVGTDDVDGHVMHIHGRACNWRSMILTQSDYDRLYRRDDLNRVPFEYARRIMMGGNPIMFVGLGMSEEELNRELREFVSNAPYRRVAPIFLLWSDDALSETQMQAARLKYLRNFGVLTIFSKDLPGFVAAPQAAGREAPDPTAKIRSLTTMIRLLGEGAARGTHDVLLNPANREMHIGKAWRCMRPRILHARQAGKLVVLWESYVGQSAKVFRVL